MQHDEVIRLYGPWRARTPADATALLRGYPGPWWIAGGWAIEAFTGVRRPHGDLDLSIPRSDVPILRRHLAGRLDVWAADSGVLRPLIGPPNAPLPSTCENLWMRRSGADPWEYDVVLMDVLDGIWTCKRNPSVTAALTEILWRRDGIAYLRPEVQLLHKAPGLRAKDSSDFAASVSLLDDSSREWLRSALALAHPDHAWLERL